MLEIVRNFIPLISFVDWKSFCDFVRRFGRKLDGP
ncbi:unnamed protein product [Rhodiola kirilowii]